MYTPSYLPACYHHLSLLQEIGLQILIPPYTDRGLTQLRKIPELWQDKENPGDDMAGIVHSVGERVYEFKPGDRVASFHEIMTKGGTFAEYAVG
jgi:hypothetical protein